MAVRPRHSQNYSRGRGGEKGVRGRDTGRGVEGFGKTHSSQHHRQGASCSRSHTFSLYHTHSPHLVSALVSTSPPSGGGGGAALSLSPSLSLPLRGVRGGWEERDSLLGGSKAGHSTKLSPSFHLAITKAPTPRTCLGKVESDPSVDRGGGPHDLGEDMLRDELRDDLKVMRQAPHLRRPYCCVSLGYVLPFSSPVTSHGQYIGVKMRWNSWKTGCFVSNALKRACHDRFPMAASYRNRRLSLMTPREPRRDPRHPPHKAHPLSGQPVLDKREGGYY